MKFTIKFIAACALFCWAAAGFAQDAAIRKTLAERLPNFPKIDEIKPTGMPGLYEVRINGTDLVYTIVRGNGKRKVAVFEDPNCGYCKKFERDLQGVNNVTVHLFLYPILGPGSSERSKNIWCAKDRAKAWTDWMVKESDAAPGNCDIAALNRNVEFGKKYKITGTPTLIFADGNRVPGAIPAAQVEKFLAEVK
jgi:thiol:disulfide interchange protein DsbC